MASPTLANAYLHYSFDLWADRWRHRHARGNVIYVRYADDIVAGFEYEDDAQRFLVAMRERLSRFALTLHPEKTRLIEFGRFAAVNRARRGLGKPETFDFLGLKHICGRSRAGHFQLKRKSRRDRMRMKLKALKMELRWRRHEPIPMQGRWLAQVVRGYFAYHAVPTNFSSLSAFLHHVKQLWLRALRRRSQNHRMMWSGFSRIAADFLPRPRILHPWPDAAAIASTTCREWRRPWPRRGSGMERKNSGRDCIWDAVSMSFGTPRANGAGRSAADNRARACGQSGCSKTVLGESVVAL
ncbi:RNA-directed DNA polymerase (Reverse transcriptase) [mine drainage metagenome]|uniref:RNA-directed DNA polymerase (Reverse transcriptase) n=1 Tax=mine drainage metagenome TaxID=410659 RepID=T1BNC0_9ZZZZ